MKSVFKRWGEITIKKQGEGKNKFIKTKSFSLTTSKNEYTVEQIKEIFKIVVDLTDRYKFEELKGTLSNLEGKK